MKYYCEEKERVIAELESSENGLSESEAERRLAENEAAHDKHLGKHKDRDPDRQALPVSCFHAISLRYREEDAKRRILSPD